MKFSELVRLLENNGFKIIKEKGSIRYYYKPGWDNLIRIDYHGSKEIPKGTYQAILKASEIKKNCSPKFLYYIFLTVNWKLYNEGSGVPSLSASIVSSIKVLIPKEEKEQYHS